MDANVKKIDIYNHPYSINICDVPLDIRYDCGTSENCRSCETCSEANIDQESGWLTKTCSAGRKTSVVSRVTGIPSRHISNLLTNK